MAQAPKRRRLADASTFPGFRPLERVQGLFGDPRARLVTLVRRGKKRSAGSAAPHTALGTIAEPVGFGICPAPITASTSTSRCGASSVGAVAA